MVYGYMNFDSDKTTEDLQEQAVEIRDSDQYGSFGISSNSRKEVFDKINAVLRSRGAKELEWNYGPRRSNV